MASALQVLRRSPSIIRSSREIISNTVAKNSLTRSPILCSAHRPFPAGFLGMYAFLTALNSIVVLRQTKSVVCYRILNSVQSIMSVTEQ